MAVQGPLRRRSWVSPQPLAVAPRVSLVFLPLQAAPLPQASYNHSDSLTASKGPGPEAPLSPPLSPSWGTSCCHLTLWCLSCRLLCCPWQPGKEECGLISAGMCPLGCPPAGEGTGTGPTQAQETQEDTGLGDRLLGPHRAHPHPAREAPGPGCILQQAECFSKLGQEMLFVNVASADTQDPGATPESAGVRERQRGSLRGLMLLAQGRKRDRSEGLRPGPTESAVGSRGKHRTVSSARGALSLPSPT